jgi:uncharacterized OB-fold protein
MSWNRSGRERHRALYWERREAGLCGQCGKKPTPGKKTCLSCRTRFARYNAIRDQRLGNVRTRGQRTTAPESPVWRQLEASQARCGVCRLLEPHVCMRGNAGDRPGAGRVFPEGGI